MSKQRTLEERLDLLVERLALCLKQLDRTLGTMEDDLESALEVARIVDAPTRLPVPEPAEISDAMLELDAHQRAVSATQIANVVWHGEQGHGDLCRLGQRLGMMSSVGLVVRVNRPSRNAYMWALPVRTAGDV